MKKTVLKRLCIVTAALLCLINLAGCAAKRIAGWEREQVKVEGDAA